VPCRLATARSPCLQYAAGAARRDDTGLSRTRRHGDAPREKVAYCARGGMTCQFAHSLVNPVDECRAAAHAAAQSPISGIRPLSSAASPLPCGIQRSTITRRRAPPSARVATRSTGRSRPSTCR